MTKVTVEADNLTHTGEVVGALGLFGGCRGGSGDIRIRPPDGRGRNLPSGDSRQDIG